MIECGEKSGTMITVDSAIRMKKPIVCYYTDRGRDYLGNKKLIEEDKADTLSNPEDIRKLINTIQKSKENDKISVSEQLTIDASVLRELQMR